MAGDFNEFAGEDRIDFSDYLAAANAQPSISRKRFEIFCKSIERNDYESKAQVFVDATRESLQEGLSVCLRYIGDNLCKLDLEQAVDMAEYCDTNRKLFTALKEKCEDDFYPLLDEEKMAYNRNEKNVISLAMQCLNAEDRQNFHLEVIDHVGKNSSLDLLIRRIEAEKQRLSDPSFDL